MKEDIQASLQKLRVEINAHDKALLLILKKRFQVVKKVALLKKKHNLPILQKARWKIIIEDRIRMGLKLKIDKDFTSALMKLIHKESVRYQISLQQKKGTKK
ncbi:MAG: chorismate mutase [Bdellovibrionales bacterium]|nr:chorismate mutase [Bdellovibrionales bacterium]